MTSRIYCVMIGCCSYTIKGVDDVLQRPFFAIKNDIETKNNLVNFDKSQEKTRLINLQLLEESTGQEQIISINNAILTYVKIAKLSKRTQFYAEGYGKHEDSQRYFVVSGTEENLNKLPLSLSLR